MFNQKKKWQKPLIKINDSEEMKKVCNTVLDKEGTIALEKRLEELRKDVILVYPETADLILFEIFGNYEFHIEEKYRLYATYDLFTKEEDKTMDNWTSHICNCYKSFILQWKEIFPKY